MKKLNLVLVALALLGFISCGEKYDELKNAAEVIKNAPQATEEMSKSVDLAEKKRNERRAKGDTLAIHFSELQKFLPTEVNGAKAEEPKGQTTSMSGFSMSTAERTYTYLDNSSHYLKISLLDYNESYAMYAGVTYWASLGLSNETADGFTKTFKTDNSEIAGIEEYSKGSKTAKISYAIGYRFLMTIEEFGASNTDNVKNVAKTIDIKKLSAL